MIPPDAARRRAARRARRAACATPRSAAATSAPSSPRTARRAARRLSSASGDGARRVVGTRWTSSTPTRSASCVRRIARLPDGRFDGDATCSRPPRATSRSTRRRHRSPATRSRSTSPAPRPSTTGTSTARSRSPARPAYFVVRCLTDARRSRLGRRLRARHGHAPAGSLVNARVAGRGRRGERRDVVPDRRRRLRGASAQAVAGPGAGPGHDEQPSRFGNERFTYYETIGGGQGAVPGRRDGPFGVHVTMSNTLNTPVRGARASPYPLRVERYASALRLGRLRPASGAATASSASCACSRTAGSRSSPRAARRAPQGEQGGDAGTPGRNFVNGEDTAVARRRATSAGGDVVTIETPGEAASARPTRPHSQSDSA